MGYDLHIVRRKDWDDDEEDSNISLEEWLAYVQSDLELELTNGYEVRIPGIEPLVQNSPGFCNWKGHSTKVGDAEPWFDYWRGMISSKYPDDETIKKMISIAARLNAKVQGDDGEFYDEAYFVSKSAQTIPNTVTRAAEKPWWKFW